MKSFKGAAHCYSDTMHNPTWSEMRKRSEPIAGKGGGNDPALANAQEMRELLKKKTKKKTTCWKGYSNIVNGKPTFKKKGKRMVPDCKPTKSKKK